MIMHKKEMYTIALEIIEKLSDDRLIECISEIKKWQRSDIAPAGGVISEVQDKMKDIGILNEGFVPSIVEKACLDVVCDRWSELYVKVRGVSASLKDIHLNMVGVINETIGSILNRVANNLLSAVDQLDKTEKTD